MSRVQNRLLPAQRNADDDEKPSYVIRIAGRIQGGDPGTPGVPEQGHPTELEVLPHCLQIVGESRPIEPGGIAHQGGAPGPALIVEEQRVLRRQRGEVLGQVIHGEAGTTMQDDDGIGPGSNDSIEESDAGAGGQIALARLGLLDGDGCGRGLRAAGTSSQEHDAKQPHYPGSRGRHCPDRSASRIWPR